MTSTELMEQRDEILAASYEKTAKDYLKLATDWATTHPSADYYAQALRCAVKAEVYQQVADELRRPKLIREEQDELAKSNVGRTR